MGCGGSKQDGNNPSSKKQELDPYFDLIMNPTLEKNEWPVEVDEHKKSDKPSLMC